VVPGDDIAAGYCGGIGRQFLSAAEINRIHGPIYIEPFHFGEIQDDGGYRTIADFGARVAIPNINLCIATIYGQYKCGEG
jgi:hypothetical protein